MKTLVVIDKDVVLNNIETVLRPHGFDFIHYRNPLKALDNIEEIAPDLVVFSAEDFPRHWKPFLRLLREFRTREECVFILLKGDLFDYDEAAKATFLEVNGVIREELDDPSDLQVIEDLISRYIAFRETRIDKRYFPGAFDDIEFIFTNPVSFKLITGSVIDLAPESMSFRPDFFNTVGDIPSGSDIHQCTLKIGGTILSCGVHVVRNTGNMAFRFLDMKAEDREQIVRYINNRSSRELSQRASSL